MNNQEKINYIELPAKNLQKTKDFFTKVFNWSFEDFGSEYCAFSNQGIDGGFYQSELKSTVNNGGALIVFYSQNIKETQIKIEKANGIIVVPIFTFPGGRRFHFTEPSGNEFAVWTDKNT